MIDLVHVLHGLLKGLELEGQLADALLELEAWQKGEMSHHNQMHGSVTGDYDNQIVNTQNADNATIIALAAKVNALAAMLIIRGRNPWPNLPMI